MTKKFKVFKVSASGKLLEEIPELIVDSKTTLLSAIFSYYKWGNGYYNSFIAEESVVGGKLQVNIKYIGYSWWFAQEIE